VARPLEAGDNNNKTQKEDTDGREIYIFKGISYSLSGTDSTGDTYDDDDTYGDDDTYDDDDPNKQRRSNKPTNNDTHITDG
jgi:hypothetical protein